MNGPRLPLASLRSCSQGWRSALFNPLPNTRRRLHHRRPHTSTLRLRHLPVRFSVHTSWTSLSRESPCTPTHCSHKSLRRPLIGPKSLMLRLGRISTAIFTGMRLPRRSARTIWSSIQAYWRCCYPLRPRRRHRCGILALGMGQSAPVMGTARNYYRRTPWRRVWANRGFYVHPYEHAWVRTVGPRVEHHPIHHH